ncbi:MAG: hypothetical protein ACLTSZ_01850 [Lachnospiraceae bacterium]
MSEENALEAHTGERRKQFPMEVACKIETIEEETESDYPAETEAACGTGDAGRRMRRALRDAWTAIGCRWQCKDASCRNWRLESSPREQLEENAAEIYRQMEESLKKNGCVAFTCTLASPLVFAVYPSSASSGQCGLEDREHIEEHRMRLPMK